MNQFKVGDTVWTVKRGKGKIDAFYPNLNNRPFVVRFDNESFPSCRFPKLSNLYRTEAEMIEAKKARWNVLEFQTHSPRVATNKETAGWREMLEGTRPIKIHVSLIDPPQPKFKRGDKVYYEGKKWEVVCNSVMPNHCNVSRFDGTAVRLAYLKESSLRLWKEHELTHCLQHRFDTWYESDYDVSKYKNIEFIGNICGHDTFLITTETGSKNLFRGKKGDTEI